ncbi:MFS transporter [Nocardia sp. NBC_00511]|uniref:MFS transporter n=1 Tax=Nocardia sp. NBC_00511 TaxID=2903591 RepID=UPI0030DEE696
MSTRIENPATPPGPAAAVARSRWPAVGSLSLGIFVIVTSEILPVGLLNPMAAGFGVTPGVAGLLLTLPGLTALIAAPVATVATARFDRRVMLTAFLLLLALANLLIAVAPSYPPVLLGRILVGVVIGGYWSIGAGLAPRVVRPEAVSTATAMIFAAVPVGSVLGVPLGTALGQEFGWRTPFLVLAVASTVIAAFGRWALPELRAVRTTSAAVLFGLVRERGTGVRTGLAVTALLVIAHFAAFTYVSPFLESATHAGNRTVAAYLLLYGVAGVAGTAITSRALIRGLRGTFVTAALLIAGCTALLPLLGRGPGGAIAVLAVWGLAYGLVPACSQTWLARSAPAVPEAATVLFTAGFQATLAAGALLGGLVVDAASTSTVMRCAAVLALFAAAVAATVRTPG